MHPDARKEILKHLLAYQG